MNYAEIVDAAPLLEKMAGHANAGLPFLAIEFDPATYPVETPIGVSSMPTYGDIEAANIEGSNAYDAASYRYLLAIAVEITGVNYGNGLFGVKVATDDGRHVAVIPVSEAIAFRPLTDIERKAFAASMYPPVDDDAVEEL